MYKYIITGASGWLGLNLLNAIFNGVPGVSAISPLSNGERILLLLLPGTILNISDNDKSKVDIIYGSINDSQMLEEFCSRGVGSILIHTAGIIHPNKNIKELYEINCVATTKLLEIAKRYKVNKSVIVSSNSPIGCNPYREHRFTEESVYNPYMNYGNSKMLMELAVKNIQDDNFPCVLIRAPWFYGPHQPARQLEFFRMIQTGKVPVVGGGGNYRSMVYLGNLAQGILLAASSHVANNKIYWIADEEAYTMNEIIDTIEDVMRNEFSLICSGRRIRLPGIFSEIAYIADFFIQSLGIYNQKIHVLSEMNKNIACSIYKAKMELGYSPQVSLREGMRISLGEFVLSR